MTVKFWNDNLKIGFTDFHDPIAIINGKVEHGKTRVNRSTLIFVFSTMSKSYKSVLNGITDRYFEIQDFLKPTVVNK